MTDTKQEEHQPSERDSPRSYLLKAGLAFAGSAMFGSVTDASPDYEWAMYSLMIVVLILNSLKRMDEDDDIPL